MKVSEMYECLQDWEMSALYARKGGDLDKAIEAFRKGNSPDRIAQILADEGLHKEAAELFLEAGEHVKAVHAFRAAGLEEQSMEIMATEYLRLKQYSRCGDCLLRLKRVDEAIDVFKKGGLFDKVGQLYETLGQFEKASRNFAKAGLFREAGTLLLKTGNFRGSARLFLQGGFSKRAFEILAQKEAWFEISRICLLLNKKEEAFHFVKKVPKDDPEYADSRLHFANYFISENKIEQALSYLKEAINDLGFIPSVKPHIFLIIDLLCRLEKFKEAEEMALSLEEMNIVSDQELEGLRVLTTQLSKRITSPYDKDREPKHPSFMGAIHLPKFDRYVIEREIGRGTQGIAYLAKDKVLDRKVVLKMLRDESLRSEDARRYFLREAKIAASIIHPNVVTLFDMGEVDGQPYTVMEYIEGITLEQYLNRQERPLSFDTIHQIFAGVCHALNEAAQHGIVHRDIKPENIMMTVDGTVKLMDFGLARGWLESPEQSAILVGTPFYMSPEQILGDPVDQRTDLYSLGIILYRMVVGHLPFTEGNILRLQRIEVPTPPIEIRTNLSKARNNLIMSLLEKRPDLRPTSAMEALELFEKNIESPKQSSVAIPQDPMFPDDTPMREDMTMGTINDVELTRFDPFSDIEDSSKGEENNSSSIESYGLESGTTLIPYGKESEKPPSDV
jgi:eukaryotic-like serine/threonine-protein kinase